jgi:hypothetical protein
VRSRSITLVDSTDLDGSLRGQTKTGAGRSIDLWEVLAASTSCAPSARGGSSSSSLPQGTYPELVPHVAR